MSFHNFLSVSRKRKFFICFWGSFIILLLFVFMLFVLISRGLFGHMPSFAELENPKNNIASEIYSADSVLLGTYYLDNRSYIYFNELSPNLVNALIAIEDRRYYSHSGIDFRSFARVFFRTILLGDSGSGGGSTITQQLAKLLFHERPESTFKRVKQKLKEWVIAVKLERSYTKEEIIAMYLSQIDFLNNAVGIKSASRIYFNSIPEHLTTEQAAVLVGMVKNPPKFNPVLNPDQSLNRRNVVLRQMYKYDFLKRKEYDSLSALPLDIKYSREDHTSGSATYLREYLRILMNRTIPLRKNYNSQRDYNNDSTRWLNDPLYGWCNKNKKADGTKYNLYKDGLRIYTNIDSRIQLYAEQAVTEHLSESLQPAFYREKKSKLLVYSSGSLSDTYLKNAIKRTQRYWIMKRAGATQQEIMNAFNTPVKMRIFSWEGSKDTVMTPLDSLRYYKYILNCGFMAMDPRNGKVKAYVGGISFKYFKYDHVTTSKRQVGSTFKPFLYSLAMEEGYSPCHMVYNVPQTFQVEIDSVYTPRSTDLQKYIGKKVTLKWGLANSSNNISAWLLKQFSLQAIVNMAYRIGIESEVLPVISMMYGTSSHTVSEMVSAFSTFANKGVHNKPVFVSRIENRKGIVLTRFVEDSEESISEETAARMLYLMQEVVNRGTAVRLRYRYNLTASIAGKTGTTQDHGDGWFIGSVPKLISGAWVGAEDPFVHFNSLKLGEGANMALPIWANFMKKVYADTTLGILPADVFDIEKYIKADRNCSLYNEESNIIPDEYEMPGGDY